MLLASRSSPITRHSNHLATFRQFIHIPSIFRRVIMAAPSVSSPTTESFSEGSSSSTEVSPTTTSPSRMRARTGRIELGDVTPHNINLLKRLNQVVFPVSYNDKFYRDVLESGELAKLAYYNDIVVGAVCCREDTTDGLNRLYIMTLGCLAPYRRLGIGTVMVNHVLKCAKAKGSFYDAIFLHVQINNDSAIDFYKKFDFEIVETKEQYYKRIEPADAHVLQKTLKKRDPTTITSTNSN